MLRGQLSDIPEVSRNLKSLNGSKPKQYGKLVFTNLRDVKVEKVDWIWKGFIAKGNLHLYAGEGGIGKSRSLFNLSAVISRGGCVSCYVGKMYGWQSHLRISGRFVITNDQAAVCRL